MSWLPSSPQTRRISLESVGQHLQVPVPAIPPTYLDQGISSSYSSQSQTPQIETPPLPYPHTSINERRSERNQQIRGLSQSATIASPGLQPSYGTQPPTPYLFPLYANPRQSPRQGSSQTDYPPLQTGARRFPTRESVTASHQPSPNINRPSLGQGSSGLSPGPEDEGIEDDAVNTALPSSTSEGQSFDDFR